MLVTYIRSLFQRLIWSANAFTMPMNNPIIKLENGILIDLANKHIVIPGEFSLHSQGNFRLSSDQHIIINSGQGYEGREDYRYSIWLNSSLDECGRPIKENNALEGKIDVCEECDDKR